MRKLNPTIVFASITSVLLSCVLTARVAKSMPIVANPSLTGPVATGSAPPDWFEWQKTPDTVDATGPFNNTGTSWTLSPDGGTFVRAGGSTFVNSEAIAQNVTGFTIGGTYQVNFFQTNLGFEHPTSGDWLGEDGYWDLVINGSTADSSTTLTKPALPTNAIVWMADSMTFVAPTSTVELALVSRSVNPSGLAAYMGIDGVSVRLVKAPEPSSFVSLCVLTVLLGVFHGRYRRK